MPRAATGKIRHRVPKSRFAMTNAALDKPPGGRRKGASRPGEEDPEAYSQAGSRVAMTTIDSQPRYLVYRCGWQGLGHIGVAILNCVRAASVTGRTLALDMRDFHYYRQDAARRFAEHFAFDLPQGVAIVTDPDAVAEICALPDRYEPPPWQGPDALLPRPERVVIITSDVVRHVQTRGNKFAFWPNRMALRGPLADRVNPALFSPEPGAATIGIYFRSGNGEFLDFRFDPVSLSDYAPRYEELVERYADIARLAARQFPGRRVRYYVASVSASFVAAMRTRLGAVISHGEGASAVSSARS